MATVGPSQQPPGSSSAPAPQPPQGPPSSDQITWEGDKMFNIYILDYCKKRGYHKTATQLVTEADIPPESKPPINAQQGLLFEWWSVFWVLFQAKNSGAGSEDAILYTKYQTQSKFQAQRAGQVPPPVGPQPPARYSIPNGAPGPAPPLQAGQMNGIGSGGQPIPYGPANPPSQPNGLPGPPGAQGQPFPPGMVNRTPMGPQQRHPNGAPHYHSPTIAPSPQSQGGPQQPPAGPMGPLGPSPHMHRAAMPPPNGPQHPQGPGSVGSAHQTPTPAYQQLSRPHSSHDTSSQNHMNPHPSPAMSGRLPPGQERSHMDGPQSSLDAELASYPADLVGEAKLRAGFGDREAQSLTAEEKQSIIQYAMRVKQGGPPNNGIGHPPGINIHGPLQNRGPLAQPMQQQLSMQQQRGAKRNSTSPGEEHETLPRNEQSPPERKRPRRTPNPAEQQQQQQHPQQSQQPQPPPPPQPQPPQQQSQPPMASIGSLPPGGHIPGSMRGMGGGQPHLNGFGGPQMHQMGMAPMTPMHAMSPNMMHGPPPGLMNPQMSQTQLYAQNQYRQAMVNVHKNNSNLPVGPGDPQSHMRGPGPPLSGRLPGQLGPPQPPQPSQPPKGMGGPMLPPGQAGMNGPLKKEESDMPPLSSGASAPTPGALLNNGPPMNPQRPPTASAPAPAPSQPAPAVSMADLPFDMSEMFTNGGGDFDFHGSLGDMELWFDPASVQDGASLDMK